MHSIPGRRLIMGLFLIFLMLPIYWLVNMSFKTNGEIISTMTLWPHAPTLQHYRRIFTDESWYSGYINSLEYVVINTIISISVALPAAYAFSRYRFLGDKHLFFWLLSNRMAPAAVYALPFFNLYSAIGLFDTPWAVALAHCIFNVPLAVWILEGFVSGVPREIDETAFLDGYSFPRFFIRILVPLIASGIGVAAFFCFMFSWVELLLARTLTSVNAKPIAAVMTRTVSAAGMDWGLLAAAGVLTIIPGRTRDLVRPQLHRARLRARPGVGGFYGLHRMDGVDAADRDLLRGAGLHAGSHDLARRRLSRGRTRRDPAHPDHARRPPVRLADRCGRHPPGVDRPRRYQSDRHDSDRGGRI
ncbi:ABC-type glycerol-3-phosphate transport system permease component [Bradyrhizobium sp. USDA 4471]